MMYTHVLNRGPAAVRSPADYWLSLKARDIRLTGNCSLNPREREAQEDEIAVRFNVE